MDSGTTKYRGLAYLIVSFLILLGGGYLILLPNGSSLARSLGTTLVLASVYLTRTALARRKGIQPSNHSPSKSAKRRYPLVGIAIGASWLFSGAYLLTRDANDPTAIYAIYGIVLFFVLGSIWYAYYLFSRSRT